MRLHTDRITYEALARLANDLRGVHMDISVHGSRSRRLAFEVKLTGNSPSRPNSGKHGADGFELDEHAATWDEWGVIIARVFELDQRAFWGNAKRPVYGGAVDFHYQTATRFLSGEMPRDTHPRHTWRFDQVGVFTCTKCSAKKIHTF